CGLTQALGAFGAMRDVSDANPSFDSTEQQAVHPEWRGTLRQVVDEFARGNYELEPGLLGVEPITSSTVSQVRQYIQGYGATLVPLPEASWDSSVCIWAGQHWDVLVDLWTKEEGRSDLVMHVHVLPSGSAFKVQVHAVYVP
ncbi:hypothetical protein LY625_13300, partial [Lysobacter sp. GX 14042]|uniref:DUF7668 domain-containing protein n=1 Tax=Lysobacter sp. GX 14042 TaxID=2907155 RepID=UPI001F2633BF